MYARLIDAQAPSDQVVARYFRLRDGLPAPARGFLAGTVYALMRARTRTLLLWQWAGRETPRFEWPEPGIVPAGLAPGEEAALSVLRWLIEDQQTPADAAKSILLGLMAREAGRTLPTGEFPPPDRGNPRAILDPFAQGLVSDPALSAAPEATRNACRFSIPMDILGRWQARVGVEESEALALALAAPAPLDIRVNTLKGTRQECRSLLDGEGIATDVCPWSAHGLRARQKTNVFRTKSFHDGWLEVQDEGSQLVAFALDPKPTWRVLDACSGGGGKSLHLAALMANRGEIYVHDSEAERLEPQKLRLRRAGVHNVRFLEPGHAGESGPYDAVLIDAPCLGLGTLRRNPQLAWRGALAQRLKEIEQLQRDCVTAYAPMVKLGGVLLYATCSLEEEETSRLLAGLRGFKPSPLAPRFERWGIPTEGLGIEGHELTLWPHRQHTDGFYLARFERISEDCGF